MPGPEPPTKGLRRAALRGAAWSGLEKWGSRLLSTAVFVILARLLDPADFGLVALAIVFVEIAERLGEQGFTVALIQREDLRDRHLHTAFWLGLAVSCGLALLLVVTARPISVMLGEPRLAPVLQALSAVFVISSLGRVPNAILLRGLAFRSLALRGIASSSVAGVLAISLALVGAGVWALVGQKITQAVVIAGVLLIAARYRPRARFGRREMRELWSFGGPVVAFDLVNAGYRRGDDLIVGGLLGTVALGYYTIAYRLLMVMTDTLTRTVQQVVLPTFSKLQDEPGQMRSAYYTATRLHFAVSAPAFAGMAAVAPELVALFFGPRWAPSVPAMQLLCIVGALQGVTWFAHDVMLAAGRPRLRLKLMTVRTVVTVAGFAVGTVWGFVGVAAASAVASVVFVPVTLLTIRPLLGLRAGVYVRQVLPAFVATAVMGLAVTLLRRNLDEIGDLVTLLLTVPFGVVVYLTVMAIVGRRELQEFISVARTITGRSPQPSSEPNDG